MRVKNMKIGPRTMMTVDGKPMLVSVATRKSTTAPTRQKVLIGVAGPVKDGAQTFVQIASDFRLEMN